MQPFSLLEGFPREININDMSRDLKKYTNIILVLILFFSGCSEQSPTEVNQKPLRIVQNEANLVERYGLWYEVNSNVPFTGVLTTYKSNIYGSNKLASQKTFKDGKYDGEHLDYHNNGQLAARKNYKNGIYHGEQISFYSNGATKERISYKFGKYEGIFESFQIDGQFIKRERYSANKKEGMQEYFFSSGKLEKIERYSAGKKNGRQESFYPDGQRLFSLENYKNGKLHGISEEFFPDGKPKIRTTYKNDLQHGMREEYSSSGSIYQQVPTGFKYTTLFEGGKEQGISETYFKGTLKALYTYKNGELHGENKEYDAKGNFKRYVYEHGGKISTNFFKYNRINKWAKDDEWDADSRRKRLAQSCETTSICTWSDEEYKDWLSDQSSANYDLELLEEILDWNKKDL